ncbi:MAG: hypothetical protein J6S56_06375 [Bacteroidales bacterium]|nr:hypothetical protein [Bacteroidales bacterium]
MPKHGTSMIPLMEFREGGICRARAKEVLDKAIDLLKQIVDEGLFTALEKGTFGDVKRPMNGGKGLAGVVTKGDNYFNPFIQLMKDRK